MLIEAFVNVRILEAAASSYVNYIYSIGLLFTAAGFIVQYLHNSKVKPNTIFISSIIACLSLIVFSFAINATLVIIFVIICLLSVGFIGGHVHGKCTDIIDRKYFSIGLAASIAIAIVIQFILQCINFRYLDIIISVILLLTIDCPSFNKASTINDDASTGQSAPSTSAINRTITYIVLVALMSMILGIEDSILVYKNATGTGVQTRSGLTKCLYN